ncbi:hypothetical protein INR49_024503 [Caranx melampygus]|nr:hypothetical protein INR49_024503 [Caranx melampygus]
MKLLPTVPTCGGGQHGLREVSELRSDAAHPDVLIIPSELRYFIKDVVGCVCVNPGRLTKGQVGGTYGRLLIQRSATTEDGKRVSPCSAAQVGSKVKTKVERNNTIL